MANILLSFLGISVSIGLIVIVLILLTPFLNKRYAAKWKYLIWIFLSVRLLIPLSGASGQFIMNLPSQVKHQNTPETKETFADAKTDAAMPDRRIVFEIPTQMTSPITAPAGNQSTGITILDVIALIWIIGCLTYLSLHFISYFHYKRQLMRKGRPIKDAHILNQISELKQTLRIRGFIRAIEYSEADSPMVLGFFRPVLVLPQEQYSSGELFFILKHELIHFKRKDVYLKLLFVTANAVHWFNPLIWIMQKEAVIDMELSCDEKVTQGASYAIRKAYTETLMSMLHKHCAKKTLLSTQFYGGIKIMKKRFKNILIKTGKKNGISIFLCAVILTLSFGTMIGCSMQKETDKKETAKNEITQNTLAPIPAAQASVKDNAPKNTTMLTFSKEGIEEQKQAVLAVGKGYSIYFPENEWQQSDSDLWTANVNQQVCLRIEHFENNSIDSVGQKLEDDGYVTAQDGLKQKQDGDLIYHAILKEFENDVWGIFYSYPTEAMEGFGRELPIIADTFALSTGTNDAKGSNPDEYLLDEDCREIKNVVHAFASAYFDGNADAMQQFLTNTYDGEIDTYKSTGTVRDLTLKGLSDTDTKKIENESYVVSLEFRDSNYEDMFLYLTCVLSKQENNWKIQSYGVEG